MNRTAIASLLLSAAGSSAAFGQMTNIDATNKYSWGENIGWMNWRDAGDPDGMQGVVVHSSFLSGFVWGENVGWINLGDGTPAGVGGQYANVNGTDFGVNRNPANGNLSGYGWGENIGWINFNGGAMATPPQPARFDAIAHRFFGYAWGENVGWINLNDANSGKYPGATISCGQADLGSQGGVPGSDGALDNNDFIVFITYFFNSNPAADLGTTAGLPGSDGLYNNNDFIAFINLFFQGCQ
ncbi:MAG: GC-type dockerin domain-anchored protein [Phycisphaerales bacterium]